MPISQQFQSILGFATTLVTLAGVAVIGRTVTGAMFHHSIPAGELDRISKEYGWWAARRAESVCPHMDVACVEREAKRLYEVTKYRR
ncbi:hypothetical protein ES707_00486 [subsurface metagenome]